MNTKVEDKVWGAARFMASQLTTLRNKRYLTSGGEEELRRLTYRWCVVFCKARMASYD